MFKDLFKELQICVLYFVAKTNREGKKITHKKIQRLLYFVYGWYLGSTDYKDSIFPEEFIKGATNSSGVIIPELAECLNKFGKDVLRTDFDILVASEVLSHKKIELLDFIWLNYSSYVEKTLLEVQLASSVGSTLPSYFLDVESIRSVFEELNINKRLF